MEIIVGALAAWGLIMLLWTLAGVMLLPLRRRKQLKLTVLVRGSGEVPELERYIHGLAWLRDIGIVWWDILILEDGLGLESRDTVQRLSDKAQNIDLVSGQELKDWLN